MTNYSAMETFVSERQATMLGEAGHRRVARRASSTRRMSRLADARRRALSTRSASPTSVEISTTSPSETVAPVTFGGLRAFFHFSRA